MQLPFQLQRMIDDALARNRLFHNHYAAKFTDEQKRAEALNIEPVLLGAPGWEAKMMEFTGPSFSSFPGIAFLKWIVAPEGDLRFGPSFVKRSDVLWGEPKHPLLNNGRPVLAAGLAQVEVVEGGFRLKDIDNASAHYRPDTGTEEIGREFFAFFGVNEFRNGDWADRERIG